MDTVKPTPLRPGDPCLATDAGVCTRGIVNAVYKSDECQVTSAKQITGTAHHPSPITHHCFYRIRFPMGSPYVDDWAVFRAHEVAPAPPQPKEAKPEPFKENYPSANAT